MGIQKKYTREYEHNRHNYKKKMGYDINVCERRYGDGGDGRRDVSERKIPASETQKEHIQCQEWERGDMRVRGNRETARGGDQRKDN